MSRTGTATLSTYLLAVFKTVTVLSYRVLQNLSCRIRLAKSKLSLLFQHFITYISAACAFITRDQPLSSPRQLSAQARSHSQIQSTSTTYLSSAGGRSRLPFEDVLKKPSKGGKGGKGRTKRVGRNETSRFALKPSKKEEQSLRAVGRVALLLGQ